MRAPDTVYRGERHVGPAGEVLGTVVTVDGRPLPIGPSRQIRDHSPTGFEWGYHGSGPSQLALALVLDATGDPELSERCYHWLKWATVGSWGDFWEITAGELWAWIERWREEERQREEGAAAIAPYLLEPTSVLVAVEGGGHHG